MSNHELKPCPFCGAAAHVTMRGFEYRVECTNRHDPNACPVNMRTHHHDTTEAAAEAWNTRRDTR